MTISEITEKLKELSDAEKEIKAKLDEMQSAFAEAVSKKQDEPPDDVRDVPSMYSKEDYEKDNDENRVFYIVDSGKVRFQLISEDYCKRLLLDMGLYAFPTQDFAELFREKSEVLLRCIYFKWKYDKDYVPDWESKDCDKWYVYKEYDMDIPEYTAGVTDTYDDNHIYFSNNNIADKCAEWLNLIYGGQNEQAED